MRKATLTALKALRKLWAVTSRIYDSVAPFPLATTVADRLVGETGVIFAIGEAVEVAVAAKVEAVGAGVADRPFAHLVVQCHERNIETDRHDEVLDRHWIGRPPGHRLGVNLEGALGNANRESSP